MGCVHICGETEGRGGKHDFQTWRTPDLIMEPCPSPHGLTNSTLQSNSDPEIPQILMVAHTPKQRSRHKLAPTASPCRDFSRGSIERKFANPDISKSARCNFDCKVPMDRPWRVGQVFNKNSRLQRETRAFHQVLLSRHISSTLELVLWWFKPKPSVV